MYDSENGKISVLGLFGNLKGSEIVMKGSPELFFYLTQTVTVDINIKM